MKKNVPVVLVSISCLLFIVAIILLLNTNYFSLNSNTSSKDNNNANIKENINSDINVNTNTNTDTNTNSFSNEDTNIEKNGNTDTNTSTNNNTSGNTDTNTITNEENLISLFETEEVEIANMTDEDNQTFRDKAKTTFTNIIDFIFYDKEINGYTFSDLTLSAKLKIIEIALEIDSKIDEKFPNYKDIIKDTYSDIKGKLALKYLEFTSSLCDTVGSDTCKQAKEDFNNMKKSFSFTFDLLKELASSGSSKLIEFYENFKDSE